MKSVLGLLAGPVILLILILVAWIVHGSLTNPAFAYSVLIGVAGVAAGWLIGFLAAPYSRDEKKRFSKLGAGLVGVVSGYLVGKIDPVVSYLVTDAKLITTPIYGMNLLIFLICLVVAAINMYVFRLYLPGKPGQ
jgi:hypothetical protein